MFIDKQDKYSEAIEKSRKGLHYHTELILGALKSNNYKKVGKCDLMCQ